MVGPVHPFTTDDFRYHREDVANNKELSPSGPPHELVIEGEKATVEIIDETTIRYSWSNPNPFFLPALAGRRPSTSIGRRTISANTTRPTARPRLPAAPRKRARCATGRPSTTTSTTCTRPITRTCRTLDPWVNSTKPPATRFVAKRNPYFHRVDNEGRQLPYIDQDRTLTIADCEADIPAKVGSGEADLQARALNFSDYTFLKEGEKRNDYTVRLWRTSSGAHLALYPNLTVNDTVWRDVFRDVRFRRALSLGVDRHEINQVLYFGLAIEGGNTVLPESPLHQDGLIKRWCGTTPTVQPAARRDGSRQARRRRRAPLAGRTADRDHRRDRRRGHRADRRA